MARRPASLTELVLLDPHARADANGCFRDSLLLHPTPLSRASKGRPSVASAPSHPSSDVHPRKLVLVYKNLLTTRLCRTIVGNEKPAVVFSPSLGPLRRAYFFVGYGRPDAPGVHDQRAKVRTLSSRSSRSSSRRAGWPTSHHRGNDCA